jgi:hypothetical protein
MRIVSLAAVALLAAACSPSPAPTSSPSPTPSASATDADAEGDDSGSDEPGAPFNPAPPGAPRSYDAMSNTAMGVTQGLTITPTVSTGPNMPPGAVFAFGSGLALTTTLSPGGADFGNPAVDWSKVFPGATNSQGVTLYDVDSQVAPPGKANAVLCEGLSTLAVRTSTNSTGDTLTIAAFKGGTWPPASVDAALCGTFAYTPKP